MQYWTAVALDGDISVVLGYEGHRLLFARLLQKEQSLERLVQEEKSRYPGLTEAHDSSHTIVKALLSYRQGDWNALGHVSLSMDEQSRFAKTVAATLRSVPAGKVVEYGVLARLSGYPGAARAVGRVMADNPFVLFVPCHRVVAAGLGWGGFGAGLKVKKALLKFEGLKAIDRSALWEGQNVNS